MDGELVAGLVLGWNFGDGHLHNEPLLAAVQSAVRLRAGRAALHLRRVAAAGTSDVGLSHRRRQQRRARARVSSTCATLARLPALGDAVSESDAVVIGSGPNGLAAAVALAQRGAAVLVLEAQRRNRRRHAHRRADVARLAPRRLFGRASDGRSFALLPHPAAGGARPALDSAAGVGRPSARRSAGGAAAPSLDETAAGLGVDAAAYRRLLEPLARPIPRACWQDALAPLGMPRHPLLMARFGHRATAVGRWPGAALSRPDARGPCWPAAPGHAILPLDRLLTGAVGLMFLLAGHVEDWPVAAGGSQAIAGALASLFASRWRADRNRRDGSLAGRPAAGTRLSVRYQSRRNWPRLPAARAAGGLRPPVQAISLRARRIQARLGPRRVDSLAAIRACLHCLDSASGRNARRDRRGRSGRVARRTSRSDPTCSSASKASSIPAALRRQANRLGLLPRAGRLDRGHDRRRSSGRSSGSRRASASGSWPGMRPGLLDFERYNPNYVGGAITGGVADLAAALHSPRRAAESLHDAATRES